MLPATTSASPAPEISQQPQTLVLRDREDYLPLENVLCQDDILLLLTPVIVPVDAETDPATDPFECMGKAIADRHSLVRHVPYTKAHGITGVHVAFIKRAKAIIFVLTELEPVEVAAQFSFAEIVAEACEDRPLIVVAFGELPERRLEESDSDFPTLIRAPVFSAKHLEVISKLLVDGSKEETAPALPVSLPEPQLAWKIEDWVLSRHVGESHDLWLRNMPAQYHMSPKNWLSLVNRIGQTHHRVVVHPHTKELIAFCLSYLYTFDHPDICIRSIAAIVVRSDFRGRGIGKALHNEALHRTAPSQRVTRVQLGSTFPRLLYGVPASSPALGWFQKQGWKLSESSPGQGRSVSDWVLRFTDMPLSPLASAGLNFRAYEMSMEEHRSVLDLVARESETRGGFGWYDQYAKVLSGEYSDHVLLGFEGDTLVAAAIVYTPDTSNSIASELPWSKSAGPDIGGVSCICIKDDPEMVRRPDTVMVRLLHSCTKLLKDKGMSGMFIDGVKHGEAGFESLGKLLGSSRINVDCANNNAGFRRWAEYKDAWRTI
jgi:GNAT superfamily N-acetyltransferase